MFDQSKRSRTVRLNSIYTVVFRYLRDQSEFRTMARLILYKIAKWLIDAYADASERFNWYLVIDIIMQFNQLFW